LVPAGRLGAHEPTEPDWADIRRALALLRAISPFDVGQAAVVADNQVLAVEGPEGTDAMLAPGAEMRRIWGLGPAVGRAALGKAAKVGENLRLALPTIGPHTVEAAAAAHLGGIAVVADTTIAAEASKIVAAADHAKLFVVGVKADQAA